MTVVDDVKARLDIIEVVSQRVPLQRSGRSYKANCPFHQERTPSFHVFPDRQSWRCFGACATGGDAISFVMRADSLDFGEALRQLAQQTGVPLPERGQTQPREEPAHQINEAAKGYFQRLLASAQGKEAREYLERRGVDRRIIESFELGLSPTDGESLKNYLTHQGYPAGQLASAGVVRTGEDGFHRDLFRGRLMFPIRDSRGQLAGFGGRSLDGSEPKYLNTPQCDAFDKSRILYALDRAREDARKNGVVIVEGYMDAIAAHQAGFTNVVASMGTALTEHQVGEIRRLTGKVTMALDQDTAGQQATLRSLESSWHIYQSRVAGQSRGTTLLQKQDIPELRIIALPEGQDPDEVIHRSPAEWRRLMDQAVHVIEYIIDAAASNLDAATPQGKAQIVDAVFPLIASVSEGTQQDHYFQLLADRLGVSLETLRASIGRTAAATRPRRAEPQRQPRAGGATASPFAKQDHDAMEEYCLSLLVKYPDLLGPAQELRTDYFKRHENREIFSRLRDMDPQTPVEEIKPGLDSEIVPHLDLLIEKQAPPLDLTKRHKAFRDVVSRLEERNLRSLKAEEEIRFSESPPDLEEDLQSILELNNQIKQNEGLRRGRFQQISP